jgi:hypothetical protein
MTYANEQTLLGNHRIDEDLLRKAQHRCIDEDITFKQLAERALLDYLPQELRPVTEFAYLTGHKTESVCRRYAIVSQSDLAEGVAELAALHQASSETVNSSRVVAFAEKVLDEVRTK